MKKSGVEYLAKHPGWKTKKRKRKDGRTWPGLRDKSPAVRAITRQVKDALERELDALHNLQAACQVVLRDVPHQKDCGRHVTKHAECTCIRADVAALEYKLSQQLDCEHEHPDTDAHRAACTSCMMAHDKALP